MTDVLVAVNYLMLFAGAFGFMAVPLLEHFYDPHVSGWKLLALIAISFALVLFGAGVWTGVDLVPVRALAAICLVLAQVGLVQETITGSK
ncbi:acyl-CoA oxidase [Haloferax sp. Atlit-4N]|uniref:acyl-CoA oxidase n=1 Tax=Haloferax sp. Atlit-4N TaxID=2077206 RepID=UPI000E25388A|nr:acyl-CoA oxidase [Haloferax sp. Atlit-4N]RDZ53108.1 acyl-CoA oxidase [Haloferax sp. Atlit-4N]